MSDEKTPDRLEQLLRAAPPTARALEGFGSQNLAWSTHRHLAALAGPAEVEYVEVPIEWETRPGTVAAFTKHRVLLVETTKPSLGDGRLAIGSARTIRRNSLESLEVKSFYSGGLLRVSLVYAGGIRISIGSAGLDEPLAGALRALYPTLLADLEPAP